MDWKNGERECGEKTRSKEGLGGWKLGEVKGQDVGWSKRRKMRGLVGGRLEGRGVSGEEERGRRSGSSKTVE